MGIFCPRLLEAACWCGLQASLEERDKALPQDTPALSQSHPATSSSVLFTSSSSCQNLPTDNISMLCMRETTSHTISQQPSATSITDMRPHGWMTRPASTHPLRTVTEGAAGPSATRCGFGFVGTTARWSQARSKVRNHSKASIYSGAAVMPNHATRLACGMHTVHRHTGQTWAVRSMAAAEPVSWVQTGTARHVSQGRARDRKQHYSPPDPVQHVNSAIRLPGSRAAPGSCDAGSLSQTDWHN